MMTQAKTVRFLLLALVGVVVAAGGTDLVRAWSAKRILSHAAREGARIAVSTPLDSPTCRDQTPCSIESAAEIVKQYLTNAGLRRASCMTPRMPSFSGVLVWVFSCDGNTTCGPSNGTVCLKIDMTVVGFGPDGKFIPSTRVTVGYPHAWVSASVVKPLTGRPTALLPKALSASVLMRD